MRSMWKRGCIIRKAGIMIQNSPALSTQMSSFQQARAFGATICLPTAGAIQSREKINPVPKMYVLWILIRITTLLMI